MINMQDCGWCNKLRNWAIDTATILFDDTHNDLRALPKTVRLQILVVLSFVWSTVFTVYFFSMATMLYGWVGLVIGHLGIIFAMFTHLNSFIMHRKDLLITNLMDIIQVVEHVDL